MILPSKRDPRFITLRRGGSLLDEDHHLLGLWAADCAEHVLAHFEEACPGDSRPRDAIEAVRAWARGEATVTQCKVAAYHANAAARDAGVPAKYAALAAGQAAAVAHVAAHDLGAAAYAIRAAMGALPPGGVAEAARFEERDWQRGRLPGKLRDLVIEDEGLRDDICWGVFADGS